LVAVEPSAQASGEVQGQDRNEHQQPAQLGKKEKLCRGICPAVAPPNGDQKIHGDKHQLPGEIEKKQVEREKHADNSGENPQHVEMVEADRLGDFRPGNQQSHETQKKREQNEQKAEAIDSQVKMNAELRDPTPIHLFKPLISAGAICGEISRRKT